MLSLNWKGNAFTNWLSENYYLIMIIVYLCAIYFPFVRPGVVMTLILLCLLTRLRFKSKGSEQEVLVSLFFLYNIISVAGFFFNGLPFSVYFADLSNQCFPIVFFFISVSGNIKRKNYFKRFLFAIILSLIIGLYFYFSNPQVYIDYLQRTSDAYYTGTENTIQRYNSLFGSTVTGTFCYTVIAVAVNKFMKYQNLPIGLFCIYAGIYILGLTCALLTSQRSSMILALLVPIVGYCICLNHHKKINIQFRILNIFLIIIVSYYLIPLLSDYYEIIETRFSSVNSMYGERDTQWKETFSHSQNLVFGTGLGSVGHKAQAFTQYLILDGALFKYIAEFGVIGFIVFILIVIRTTLFKLKDSYNLFIEYVVVIGAVLQSTGSNTLAFQMVLPLFWTCMGFISKFKNSCKRPKGRVRLC